MTHLSETIAIDRIAGLGVKSCHPATNRVLDGIAEYQKALRPSQQVFGLSWRDTDGLVHEACRWHAGSSIVWNTRSWIIRV